MYDEADDLLGQAMNAEPGEMLHASPAVIRAVASRGFYDGLKMAAAAVDDPISKARLWALSGARLPASGKE